MTDFPKPDLSEMDVDDLLILVSRGRVALSEIPQRLRSNVESKIKSFEERQSRIKAKAAADAEAKAQADAAALAATEVQPEVKPKKVRKSRKKKDR